MEQKKLRILINSNGIHTPTGYASQIQYLVPMIRDEGYPVAISAFYGIEGGMIGLDGIMNYPRMGDPYGADAMLHHGKHFGADVVITMQDIWTLNMDILRAIPRFIPIVFADHDPVTEVTMMRARMAYRLISPSKFAYDQMKRQGLHSTYIPLMVDTDIFKKRNRSFRAKINVPDTAYLFGMVADNKDNPPRKSFQEVMDAFKLFKDKHPEALIYFHSLPQQAGGFPIDAYARFLGIQDAVRFPDPYEKMYTMTKEDMSYVLSAFDCYVAPSRSEGFGVPVAEAQACEVPVITNTFASMPELVIPGKTGELCDVMYKVFSGLGSYVGQPDPRSIYECMEKIYRADRAKMGKAGRKHIAEQYDKHKVFNELWRPFLMKLEREVYP